MPIAPTRLELLVEYANLFALAFFLWWLFFVALP
jgi:hypothetical protein